MEGTAQANPIVGGQGNLQSLIAQKEQELHDINDYRLRTLEQLVREKSDEVDNLHAKMAKLKEDFAFNLKLIEDRDAELARYDTSFGQLRGAVRDKEVEVSELKMQIAEFQATIKQGHNKLAEQESYFVEKLKDAQEGIESTKWNKEDALRRQQEAFESVRRDLDRQLRERGEDIETQRREITATFDEVLRQKESEHRRKVEELMSTQREADNRLTATARELKQRSEETSELRNQIENAASIRQDLEKRIKATQWELEDVRKLKDTKIEELTNEKGEIAALKQSLLDEYEGKMSELLSSLHAVERAFSHQKEQYEVQLQNAANSRDVEVRRMASDVEQRLSSLTQKLNDSEAEVERSTTGARKMKWEFEERLAEKDRELEQLRREAEEQMKTRDTLSGDMKQQLLNRDLEIKNARENSATMRSELQRAEVELSSCKAQLTSATEALAEERRASNNTKLQLELQWTARIEEASKEYDSHISTLQQQRDLISTESRNANNRILELEDSLSELRKELNSTKAQLRMRNSTNEPSAAPMFDGDLGPPSPLASLVSSANTHPFGSPRKMAMVDTAKPEVEKPVKAVGIPPISADLVESDSGPTTREASLMAENKRLAAALAAMRCDIEGLRQVSEEDRAVQSIGAARGDHAPPSDVSMIHEREGLEELLAQAQQYAKLLQRRLAHSNAPADASAPNQATTDLEEEVDMLRAMVASLNQQLTFARSEAHRLKDSLDTAVADNTSLSKARDHLNTLLVSTKAECTECNKRIAELENEVNALNAPVDGPAEPTCRIEQVVQKQEVQQLREQLSEARGDLVRLLGERDELLELSNQLKSQLNQSLSKSIEASHTSLAAAVSDMEGRVKSKYADKIAVVEQELENLAAQNRSLRQQLRDSIGSSGAISGPSDPAAGIGQTKVYHGRRVCTRKVDEPAKARVAMKSRKGLSKRTARTRSANGTSKTTKHTGSTSGKLRKTSKPSIRKKHAAMPPPPPPLSEHGLLPTSFDKHAAAALAARRHTALRAASEQQQPIEDLSYSLRRRRLQRREQVMIVEGNIAEGGFSDASQEMLAGDVLANDRYGVAEEAFEEVNGIIDAEPDESTERPADRESSSSLRSGDARQRLLEAREQLELAGRSAPVDTKPAGRTLTRETMSQKRARNRLQQGSRRRSDMVSARRKVRNYNKQEASGGA